MLDIFGGRPVITMQTFVGAVCIVNLERLERKSFVPIPRPNQRDNKPPPKKLLSPFLRSALSIAGPAWNKRSKSPLFPVKLILQRRMMNKIKISKFVEFSSSTLAVLTIVLVMTVSSASAKEQKPKGSGAESQVVAHISFSGLSAVDMVMQKKVNDQYYLYVQH